MLFNMSKRGAARAKREVLPLAEHCWATLVHHLPATLQWFVTMAPHQLQEEQCPTATSV